MREGGFAELLAAGEVAGRRVVERFPALRSAIGRNVRRTPRHCKSARLAAAHGLRADDLSSIAELGHRGDVGRLPPEERRMYRFARDPT